MVACSGAWSRPMLRPPTRVNGELCVEGCGLAPDSRGCVAMMKFSTEPTRPSVVGIDPAERITVALIAAAPMPTTSTQAAAAAVPTRVLMVEPSRSWCPRSSWVGALCPAHYVRFRHTRHLLYDAWSHQVEWFRSKNLPITRTKVPQRRQMSALSAREW